MPVPEDKLAEWWKHSNTRNILLPAAQATMPFLPGGVLNTAANLEYENVMELLGGNRSLSEAYAQSPTMQSTVQPMIDFGSMVGRALDDPRSLYDVNTETGEVGIGQKPIETAADAAMMLPMAGIGSVAESRLLASGPKTWGEHPTSPHPASGEWGKAHPDYEPTIDPQGDFQLFAHQYAPPPATPLEYLTGDELAHLQGQGYDEGMIAGMSGEEVYKALGDTGFSYITPDDLQPKGGGFPTATQDEPFQQFGQNYTPPPEYLTGDELAHLQSQGYDDSMLAGMTGIEAQKTLEATGYYPDAPPGFGEQYGLKTIGNGQVLVPEEVDHLMAQGLTDEQISSMSIDEAHEIFKNTGYYPDPLAGENWAPSNQPAGGYSFDPGFDDFDNPQYMKSQAIDVAQGIFGSDESKIQAFLQGATVEHNGHTYNWYDEVHEPIGGYLDKSPLPDHPLAQKPYYGTGSQETDDLLEKASAKGWNPYTLAGKYTTGELDDTDLTFHSLTHASTTSGPVYEHLKKGYTGPSYSGAGPDPLAVKPLQPGIAPWAQTPSIPPSSLEHRTPEWGVLMQRIYEGGQDENELLKEFLGNPYSDRRREAAASELLTKYPPSGDPRSIVTPHGFYTGGTNWKDRVERFLQEGFPGDAEARQRAEDMGIDLNTTLWHAARHPMLRFRDPSSKAEEQAIFLSRDPDIASSYGKYLYPLHPRLDDPLVKDWGGRSWSSGGMLEDLINEARGQGRTYAIGKNMKDVGGLQDQYMMLDNSGVRSPWAQFDPKKKGSPDWLAGGGVPFNPFDFLAQPDQAQGQFPSPNPDITPQERYLYQTHRQNLAGGGVKNPDQSISTLRQMTVENDGRHYNVPTVWDGKILPPQEAMKRAGQAGWGNWPSYGSEEEAQRRYDAMHPMMDEDVRKYLMGTL